MKPLGLDENDSFITDVVENVPEIQAEKPELPAEKKGAGTGYQCSDIYDSNASEDNKSDTISSISSESSAERWDDSFYDEEDQINALKLYQN